MHPDPADAAVGRFLTIADAAELLSLSAAAVFDLIQAGEITAIRTGGRGRWRIEADMIDRYLEGQFEQSRRMQLWNEAELAPLPEISGGRRIR